MEHIQSLEELYRKLKNENCFSEWKRWMEFEEFDFENVADDVNGPYDQSDMKHIVSHAFYRKIQASIKGQSQHNITNNTTSTTAQRTQGYDEDMIQLIRALRAQISNKQALELILQQIIIDKFDFGSINDDIEDANESHIGSYLREHNINDSTFAQFCDIVRSFQEDETTNNTAIKPPVITQQHTLDMQPDDEWYKVLVEMKRSPMFTEQFYYQVVQKYKDDEYELEDVAEETYEDSVHEMIKELFHECYDEQKHRKLHVLLVESARRVLYNDNCNTKMISATTQTNNPIPRDPQYMLEPTIDEAKLKYVNVEDGDAFKHMIRVKQQIERLNIEDASQKAIQNDGNPDISFVKTSCTFGINSVQEMIDLWMVQLGIAYNHDTYELKRNHLMLLHQQFMGCFRDFVYKTFEHIQYKDYNNKLYFDGLNVVAVQRFLGYGTFTNIIIDLSKKKPRVPKALDDEEMGYKPCINKRTIQYKASHDNCIYWSAQQIQMHFLAFIITLSNHFSLHCESIDNCAAILEISVPNILNGYVEETDKKWQYNEFKKTMDSYVMQFHKTLDKSKRQSFEHNMKQSHIACWSLDLSKETEMKEEFDCEPHYIGRTADDLGYEIDEKEYRECYEKVHLWWLMRTKRIFTKIKDKQKNRRKTKLGIAVHKCRRSIKLYLHYQGAVVRMQFEDIGKWFKDLFKYHTNELNQGNWCLVEQYLDKISGNNQTLAHPESWKDENKNKVSVWDERQLRLKSWNDLDSQFLDKNLNLCQDIVNIKGMEQFIKVYNPFLEQLRQLKMLKKRTK
eukprot:352906_1